MERFVRPQRTQIATNRFDAPPHLRWAWERLIALYVPYAGDGMVIPNRAPSSPCPPLRWNASVTATPSPSYGPLGLEVRGDVQFRAPFPPAFYDALRSTRLSVLWAGWVGEGQSGEPTPFGVSFEPPNYPYGFLHVEGTGPSAMSALSAIDPSRGYIITNVEIGYGTRKSYVLTRTTDSFNTMASGQEGPYRTSHATQWDSFVSPSSAVIVVGRRYASNPANSNSDFSLGAIWAAPLNDAQMLLLERDPFGPFTKWRRVFAAAPFFASASLTVRARHVL